MRNCSNAVIVRFPGLDDEWHREIQTEREFYVGL